MYVKITTKHLNIIRETSLVEQHGFLTGHACADCMFVLRGITQFQTRYDKTGIQFGHELKFCDYIKAFDRILGANCPIQRKQKDNQNTSCR
jgi:hypothetical protein